MGESSLICPKIVYESLENVWVIRDRFKTSYSQQKSYADHRRRDLEFKAGDWVHLIISPMKGVIRFGEKGKLSSRYVGPYKVLQQSRRIAYEFKLPSELASFHPVFHVCILKKCIGDLVYILPI